MEYETEDRMVSEFNEAKFQIYRLHGLWVQCKAARESGRLIDWKWALDTASIELSTDAQRLDKESTNGWVAKLNKLDEEIDNAEFKRNFKDLYNSLKNKEKLLRSLQEAAGKGAKFRAADEDFDMS